MDATAEIFDRELSKLVSLYNDTPKASVVTALPELLKAAEYAAEVIEGLQTGKIWSRQNMEVIRARRMCEAAVRKAKGL